MKNIFPAFLIALGTLFLINLKAQETDEQYWPKEITSGDQMITLYQPQLESFKNNILEGRMALSVRKNEKDPVFGAMWFKCRLSTDLELRTATLENIDIVKMYFPGIDDQEKIDQFTQMLTEEIESWDLVMSLDRLLAGLNEVDDLNKTSASLNNNPPDIYFRTEPTVLISIDGDPILKKIDGANFEYVVNTPFFIVQYANNNYYIKGGKFWYISKNLTKGYEETKQVPEDILKFAQENLSKQEPDSIADTITIAPKPLVVTKPSELILTDGEPDYTPIKGTSLLYVSNSSNDILMDINSQLHYVLLAGRWYSSKSLGDGDWKFVEPKDLPEDFAKIPEDSDIADVRASVPGTPEAQDALLEQSIPQTATIDRKTAKVDVQWDGNPQFDKIDGTDISVGKNSDKTVLLISNKYYCVDDAVWFVADSPTGPWIVSDTRPEAVDQIPPESSAYNVKYVYIYESTPEYVYVGYLPGYTWSYVYGGCVVYGTGYWYRPWYGYYYYPRPVTWGFGVHWNPWTGWGFSFGFSYGWIGWSFHPYRGWWGPAGYRYGYRHGYYSGYHHGYYHGYQRGAARGYAAGYRAGSTNQNIYKHRSSGVAATAPGRNAQVARNLDGKTRPSSRPNNVYTDRSGNVYQRNKKGQWENINNQQRTKPATNQVQQRQDRQKVQPQDNRSRQKPSISSQQQQQLNRSYQNRSRGTQNYNRSHSVGGGSGRNMSRPAGGGRRR